MDARSSFMADNAAFLAGGGHLGELISLHDWASTPLGPIGSWPQSLKSALNIALSSSFPTAIYWGPELHLLYNDAWAPVPAERHPWALGRPGAEVWSDIWDVVGPQFEAVMTTGQGFATFDQLLRMERGGRPRDTYWNYSLTPIIGEDGQVAGIFNQGNEITERLLQERRHQFLLRFSDELRRIDSPREIIDTSQRLLGEHFKANRVGYGDVDDSERYFTTLDNWTDGVPSRHGTHDLAGFGPEVHNDLKAGVPLVIEDVHTDPRTSDPAIIEAFAAIDTRAAVTASLARGGRMLAALYVHVREPRSWSDVDVLLVQEVAARTWAELARARAEAHAGASEERYRRIFEQASDLILTADLDQVITDCNPAAAAAVGLTRAEAIGRKISDFISPDDFSRSSEMLRTKLEHGGTTQYDVRVRSHTGEWLSWEISSGLTFDDAGKPVGLHVVARDVTERKRFERHQQLLVGELNHRVKNTLAIVQSLAHQSFNAASPADEAIRRFEGRLEALAAAHNLLTRKNWEAATVSEVVDAAIAPFCSPLRCSSEGPHFELAPQTAVSLALALHELATNASKYGALSTVHGTVAVTWSLEGEQFVFRWEESDGPAVVTPTRRGFGTRLIERILAAEFGGAVDLDFAPSGVVCTVAAPIEAAQAKE